MSGILMMVSFLRTSGFAAADAACVRAWQNMQLFEIAPSDGTLAAATTTSSDFGSHRFMDSFKANNCHLVVQR
jgi:hypothetical protein